MSQARTARSRHLSSRDESRPRTTRPVAPACIWCGVLLRGAAAGAALCEACEPLALQAVELRLSEIAVEAMPRTRTA